MSNLEITQNSEEPVKVACSQPTLGNSLQLNHHMNIFLQQNDFEAVSLSQFHQVNIPTKEAQCNSEDYILEECSSHRSSDFVIMESAPKNISSSPNSETSINKSFEQVFQQLQLLKGTNIDLDFTEEIVDVSFLHKNNQLGTTGEQIDTVRETDSYRALTESISIQPKPSEETERIIEMIA